MRKFIGVLCIVLGLLVGAASAADIAGYKGSFKYNTQLSYDIMLKEAYVLYGLLGKEVVTADVTAVLVKLEENVDLRLSLSQVYLIKKVVDKASDSEIIIIMRSDIQTIIDLFKTHLVDLKTEVIKQSGDITTLEDVVTAEEVVE